MKPAINKEKNYDTATFYSISNCQEGLSRVTLGNFLIKRVVYELQEELPNIKNYGTLSPMPGFAKWVRLLDENKLKEIVGNLPSQNLSFLKDENLIVWSDIPFNRMLYFDISNGKTGVFRNPSYFSNGNSVDLNGNHFGSRAPSSEWRMHMLLYLKKSDIKAISHSHSFWSSSLSCLRKKIPSFHYMVAMAGGHDIKCAKYATFGTRDLSKNILKALKGRKACLISNHGQIAFEESLSKAFELAEEVENISLQYITSLKLGRPKILSINEMKKVLSKAKNYKRG